MSVATPTSSPALESAASVPTEIIWRLSVDQYPDYRQRQAYGPADAIPFMLEGSEVGRIVVQELLP